MKEQMPIKKECDFLHDLLARQWKIAYYALPETHSLESECVYIGPENRAGARSFEMNLLSG